MFCFMLDTVAIKALCLLPLFLKKGLLLLIKLIKFGTMPKNDCDSNNVIVKT